MATTKAPNMPARGDSKSGGSGRILRLLLALIVLLLVAAASAGVTWFLTQRMQPQPQPQGGANVQLAVGQGRTTFLIEGGIPVESVRCIAGPSAPRVSPAFGDTAWRLISHLSLNYLSLIEQGGSSSAQMLRDMLALYRDPNDAAASIAAPETRP